jgi:hypothetical protein
MFKRTTTTAPATSATRPRSLDEIFSTASGASAYAKSTFRQTVDDLELANTGFADVESQAAAEIARLEGVRAEAAAGRQSNAAVIENLRALLGE